MVKNLRVLVFIPTYHGWEDTKECIDTLKKSTYKNFDVLVADNSEDSEDAKELRKCFPKLKIIENRKDLGLCDANNQGIEYAIKNDYDYVWILNNDVSFDKDCLKEMIDLIKTNKNVGVIGPKSYRYGTKMLQPIARMYKPLIASLVKKIGEEEDRGQFDKVEEVDYLWGGSLLINIESLKEVGMYDPEYFLYYEPLDLQLRIKNAGYKILYCPEAKMWHKIGKSQPTSRTFDYYAARNRFLIVKKFNKFHEKLIFYFYFFFLAFPSNVFKRLYKGKFKSTYWFLEGVFDALRGRYGFKYH